MIRWGILGAARIAARHFLPALAPAPRNRAVAIAARDPTRARAMAEAFAIPTVHADYPALLADPGVDAIYVPLATSLHAEWTEKVIRAGKHVLCEKPIGMNTGEIDRLIAARDATGEKGVKAAEGFMVTHHPQWAKVRALLADGAIGELVQADAVFTYNNTDPANMRNVLALGGGGLRDIGVYPTVTTRFATGLEPLRARAEIRFDPDAGIDTHAYAALDFGAFQLRFTCATRQARRQSIVFHGTDGHIEVLGPFNTADSAAPLVRLRRQANMAGEVWDFSGIDQFTLQAEAFAAWVEDGADWPMPLEASWANQACIDALFASEAAGRTWVPVARRGG